MKPTEFKPMQHGTGWRASYRQVHIQIFESRPGQDSLGRPKGKRQWYFCLRRAGAPTSGPAASRPQVFLNSSNNHGGMFSTRLRAQRAAIVAIDEGKPIDPSIPTGLSRGQANRKLDQQAQALKDDINRYGEMAALTEKEYDFCITYIARVQRIIKQGALRLVGDHHSMIAIPPWKRGAHA